MLNTVTYWLDLAEEDVGAAHLLLAGKKYLHAVFFLHLAAEKALKAVIASATSGIPPRTHDLVRLAERGGVLDELGEQRLSLLEELTPLNIEARYPEHKERIADVLTHNKALALLTETEGFLCWIKQRLKK